MARSKWLMVGSMDWWTRILIIINISRDAICISDPISDSALGGETVVLTVVRRKGFDIYY